MMLLNCGENKRIRGGMSSFKWAEPGNVGRFEIGRKLFNPSSFVLCFSFSPLKAHVCLKPKTPDKQSLAHRRDQLIPSVLLQEENLEIRASVKMARKRDCLKGKAKAIHWIIGPELETFYIVESS